jgi:hypothetical protein
LSKHFRFLIANCRLVAPLSCAPGGFEKGQRRFWSNQSPIANRKSAFGIRKCVKSVSYDAPTCAGVH